MTIKKFYFFVTEFPIRPINGMHGEIVASHSCRWVRIAFIDYDKMQKVK